MQVTFIDYNPNTPFKERYEYITDYISHDFDLKFDDVLYLIRQLKHNRNSVIIYAQSIADFHIFDNELCVQIDGNGFWFAENISFESAQEILRKTFDGCEYFDKYVPATTKEWEAYNW